MIRPLNNRILVLPDVPTTESRGGIVKPDISQERPVTGTVVDVGKDVKDRSVGPGAVLLYGKFSGSEIVLDDVEFVMLQEDEVMAVEVEGDLTVEHLVLAIREQRRVKGVELRTVAKMDETTEMEIENTEPVLEPEPLECPFCFRKHAADHECSKRDFKVVTYVDLVEYHTQPETSEQVSKESAKD